VHDSRRGHFAQVAGFHIFVDEDRYASFIGALLDDGCYEGKERELVLTFVEHTDKVIEVGTGIGVVSMTAANIVGAKNVVTFDANPHIVEDAKENFVRNGMGEINSNVAVLVCRERFVRNSDWDFHISEEFWVSRLFIGDKHDDEIIETIKVRARCLEEEIDLHKATILICDIEGGEIELLSDADLSGIRLIIIETHSWAVGRSATDKLISRLISQGFHLELDASEERVSVLRRL
jgi:FkbM family methyltransferase